MEVGTSILLEICAVHESLFGTKPTCVDPVAACPLLGDQRTWLGRGSRSDIDPFWEMGRSPPNQFG